MRNRPGVLLSALVLLPWVVPAGAADETVTFDLTPAHIAQLREALIAWDTTEAGAPTFDPGRPYGDAKLSGARKKLHRDMEKVLQIALTNGRLARGEYSYPNRLGGRRTMVSVDLLAREAGGAGADPVHILVTDEHLKLLKHASIRWTDWPEELGDDADGLFAVPGFDPKRPYGNFTSYEIEMALHLGIPVEKDKDGAAIMPPALRNHMQVLHEDMQAVLQVFVQRAEIAPGRYVGNGYGHWERR